jgi:hypothetical protein
MRSNLPIANTSAAPHSGAGWFSKLALATTRTERVTQSPCLFEQAQRNFLVGLSLEADV